MEEGGEMSQHFSIEIPREAWWWEGEGKSRGFVTLYVNGVPLHLEAWRVERDHDGAQLPVVYPDAFDALVTGFGPDGPFQTLNIGGEEYVLFASPFC
jgi:hypothetical protein